MDEKTTDEERIGELRSQVESLQLKLHQLHATDANTLRRGFVTVAQHVDALKHEAARLEQLADELEPELYPPEYIAEELSKAAVVSGAVYGLFKLVKTITPLPSKATSWIRGSLVAVTAIVVSWRFAASSLGRFAASLLGHKRRRKALLNEVAELQHRIDILHALTHSMPGVPAAPQQQQPGEPGGAGSSAAAAGVPAGRECSPPAEQRDAQFVVVDLPRVESGGFVLTSPTASSPAPELAAAQQSAAAVAAATATLAVAATAAAAPQQLSSTLPNSHVSHAQQHRSQLQQQQLGVVLPAAMAAVAAAPQQQQQQATAASSASSSARSSLDVQQQQQQLRSAFSPPSMVMSGWGGVVMQQEHRAHQHLQRDASATSAAAAAGDARHTSSDLEGQGEWVEQPVEAGNNDTAGNTGRQQQQGQGSPASLSSDEGVLLERE